MQLMGLSRELLLSPSPESEALSRRIVRSQNRFLLHAVWWIAISLLLLTVNLVVSDFSPPWSLYAILSWGAVLAVHGFVSEVWGRKRREKEHRRLCELWRNRSRPGDGGASSETRELRQKLLAGAEAARRALRPISPEATADVSRGEASALDLVAWLDRAEPVLARGAETLSLRHDIATALSRPIPEVDRAPLERLLTQLDLQDVKLAVLEREAHRRRSVLESFLLVLESAGMAGSSTDVLTAVSDPLKGRVRLLQETVGAEVAGAAVGEEPAVSSDRIREEVRLAQELQSSILPRKAPEIPGLEVAHLYRPSSEVGGDFFDFYETAPGRLLVAVGDASGHGLDSSMVSSMMKSALYTHVSANRDLDESMVEMNRMMCDTVGRRRLMTLALLEIDVQGRRLRWVNAGHVFPLMLRESQLHELEQSAYPLGVRREVEYAVVEERLQSGDRIVLVTDGCIEALDPEGEVYGWERLGNRLRSLAADSSRAVVDELAEDLWSHLDGKPPQDDITLVVVAFEP